MDCELCGVPIVLFVVPKIAEKNRNLCPKKMRNKTNGRGVGLVVSVICEPCGLTTAVRLFVMWYGFDGKKTA